MENVEFKAMPDEEIRKLALSHQVEEWPVSLVRELALRDYRPISDRPDLIEACEGWVGKALEAASERFGKLAEDLPKKKTFQSARRARHIPQGHSSF